MYCFLFSEQLLEHFLLQLILAWGSRYTNKTTSSRVKERYLIAKAQTIHDVCFDRIRQNERGSQNIVNWKNIFVLKVIIDQCVQWLDSPLSSRIV